jgi:hypothetical protein
VSKSLRMLVLFAFSRASLSTSATIIGSVGGLPGLRCGQVHLRATSS